MRLTSVPWSTILDYANKFVIIMLMNVIRFDVPISGDIEDAELLYSSYYDPVLYPVVLPESPLEDVGTEANEPAD
ncbi:zinc finger MYM-type protein 1-like [Iris pallida]|uniref:Zinc finger MYM-type protein 1-like n=1 Tax=Iris pallida TaxID=29817 RepID=A0AAX6HT72_IRIPA|nr:zinc finger MYM-type protein 1-like [Iris pallida]